MLQKATVTAVTSLSLHAKLYKGCDLNTRNTRFFL